MSVALSLSYMRFSSCREKGDAMTVRHSLCEEEYKTSSLPASFMSCCFPVFLSTSPGLSPPWEGRESTSDGCQVPGTVLGAWGQQWSSGFKRRCFLGVLSLGIWGCHCSGSGCCYGAGLIPGLGTSTCHGRSQKEKMLLEEDTPQGPPPRG